MYHSKLLGTAYEKKIKEEESKNITLLFCFLLVLRGQNSARATVDPTIPPSLPPFLPRLNNPSTKTPPKNSLGSTYLGEGHLPAKNIPHPRRIVL